MTALILVVGCSPKPDTKQAAPIETQTISQDAALKTTAADFVRLALAFGAHEANYVDAYTGPQSIADDVKSNPLKAHLIKCCWSNGTHRTGSINLVKAKVLKPT